MGGATRWPPRGDWYASTRPSSARGWSTGWSSGRVSWGCGSGRGPHGSSPSAWAPSCARATWIAAGSRGRRTGGGGSVAPPRPGPPPSWTRRSKDCWSWTWRARASPSTARRGRTRTSARRWHSRRGWRARWSASGEGGARSARPGVRRAARPSPGRRPGLFLQDAVRLDGEDAAGVAQVEELDQLGIDVQLVAVLTQAAGDAEAEPLRAVVEAEGRVEARVDELSPALGAPLS